MPPSARPKPSFGALVGAGDPAESNAGAQPQSGMPLAWPCTSALVRRPSSGIREHRCHVDLPRPLHRLLPRLTGLQANRTHKAAQLAYLGILETLAFVMQCRERIVLGQGVGRHP
eukprot:3909137-Pyramimonas_sp.AAC.1